MGVVPIVLVILAMKIPIFGLLGFVWWASREPEQAEGPAEEPVRGQRPLRPQPTPSRHPRRRGPHGGGAATPMPGARRRGDAAHPAPAALGSGRASRAL
jgi:hypothetical protein